MARLAIVLALVTLAGAPAAARDLRLTSSHTYSCALDARGVLYCWGTTALGSPTAVRPIGQGRSINAADEPYAQICMIGSDGRGTCAGGEVKDAIDVGAGNGFACGLDRQGKLSCWGGPHAYRPEWVPRQPATQLCVGATHACARMRDGGVACWGQGFLGQLGVSRESTSGRVPISDVAGVACGTALSCAWKTDGSAWCWGDLAFNGLGSLGTGDHQPHPAPVRVPGVSDVVSISAGSNHTVCALDRAGGLTCWGHGYQGIFGDLPGSRGPTKIPLQQPIDEVAVGGMHVCVRTRAGAIWCWGGNEFGQLGHDEPGVWGPREVRLDGGPRAAPVAPTAAKVTRLASGARRIELALDSAASLRAAGWNRVPGGQSTFDAGRLQIKASGFEEWTLAPSDAVANPFIGEAGNPGGWAVEAKLQLDEPCAKFGTGFWIHDGFHFLTARINDHELRVEGARAEIGSTLTPRVIRIVSDGATVTGSVDGKVVLTTAASERNASRALMFGVLGDGCGRDRSTWHHVAYETFPAPPRASPPRDEWHPGTTSAQIAAALPPALTVAARGRDPACLAIAALDVGVRDLLAKAYREENAPSEATWLEKRAPPLDTARGREEVTEHLRDWMRPIEEPICTPPPGGHCPPPKPPQPRVPVPALAEVVARALTDAERWADHPKFAERAVRTISDAFAQALAAKLPGASPALDNLRQRIRACR